MFVFAAAAAFAAGAAGADITNPPTTWNGLVLVPAKGIDAVYLLPNADFRVYSKVLLDPAEVALAKDWLRDYNRSTFTLQQRISDQQARNRLEEAAARASQIFSKAFTDAGYQLVTAPGPDVLEITPMIVNVRVSAPESMSAGRTTTFSENAGDATLAIQAKDSLTHQVLGLALDHQVAGDFGGAVMRSSASNLGDFEDVVRNWAKRSAAGLGKLKQMSPVSSAGQSRP